MSTTTVTITPWGNSHGIRLTRELMQSLGVSADTQLQARVVGKGQLELRAVPKRKSLAEKLKTYDPTLLGGEISDGVPVGAEFGAKA
jgi:antitoxin component of MazEF toxin-antitoxin module